MSETERELPADLVIESTTDDEAGIRSAFGLSDAAVDDAVATSGAGGEEHAVVEQLAAPAAAIEPVVEATGPKKTAAQTRKDAIQAEINASTRAKHDAQRELEALTRQVETARAEQARLAAAAPKAPAAAAVPATDAGVAPAPEIDQFDDLTEYHAAMKTWAKTEATRAADVAVAAAVAARNVEYARQETEKEVAAGVKAKAQANERYRAQLEVLRQDDPSVDELLETVPIELTQVMEAAILTSDRGAEITRYLLQHPDDAAALHADTTSIGPEGLSLVRRSLESRLTTATTTETGPVARRRTTETPAPMKPVSTGAPASTKRLDELSPEEYNRVRNAEEFARASR